MRPSARKLEIRRQSCFLQSLWLFRSAEMLQNAPRHTDRKRRFVVSFMIDPHFLFFSINGLKREDVFLLIISVFCVYGWTGVSQISGVFLSLLSVTNARARQDLYDSKQCCFCPHVLLNLHKTKVSQRGFNQVIHKCHKTMKNVFFVGFFCFF